MHLAISGNAHYAQKTSFVVVHIDLKSATAKITYSAVRK